MAIFNKLNCEIMYDEPLKNHTTFGIGGKCIAVVKPNTIEEIIDTIKICKENSLKYFFLGKGSNLLVKDSGFNGVIIKLAENFNKITVFSEEVTCQSGATLREVFDVCLKNSLSGFEFASGIPGTIGGGVYMNAGAYGGELKDVVKEVVVLNTENYSLETLSNEEMKFSYRKSNIQKNNYLVISVTLKLEKGIYEEIKNNFEDLDKKRSDKQPLEFKSGGSTFKRPEGFFAAKLIEDSGLKGYRINDAMVSEKHAGFVINVNNASFKDIINVVEYVKNIVYEKFGVYLEMEVKILGD